MDPNENIGERPQLSLQERDRRWRLIRDGMRRRGLSCLIIWGDSGKWDSKMAHVRYVSHIGGNGEEGVCVFPLEGDPTVIIWIKVHTFEWREGHAWVSDVRGREFGSWSGSIAERLVELKMDADRIGVVGLGGGTEGEGSIPYGVYEQLKTRLPKATLENATDLLIGPQLVKSAEEIAFLEKATQIGNLGAKAMIDSAKPGTSERDVMADAISAMLKAGSDYPIMFLFNSGSPPFARRSSRLMVTRGRTLKSGDLINTEYSPRYGGYYSHLQRTFFVGEARHEYREIFQVALESHHAGLKALRPGLKLGELVRIMHEPMRKAGLELCGPYFHGIGQQWMAPWGFPPEPMGEIDVMPPAESEMEMKTGMVLAFEVAPKTRDGAISFSIGDPVLVTDSGARSLSPEIDIVITR
jgi:Xaa-Pro dipeptidase